METLALTARYTALTILFVIGTSLSLGVQADSDIADTPGDVGGYSMQSLKLDKGYVLGLTRYDLDSHTEILGWQLSNSWYFGRQDGEDSGLTLVWQQEANQFSLSKDGVRLTRRF